MNGEKSRLITMALSSRYSFQEPLQSSVLTVSGPVDIRTVYSVAALLTGANWHKSQMTLSLPLFPVAIRKCPLLYQLTLF